MSEPPVRVVIAEDNDTFRETLELLLGLGGTIEVVGSVADGEAAVELCVALRPQVVLMDYRLPVLDGVQATEAIRERCPDVAVVALTAEASAREVDALFAAGAEACLSKDERLEAIVEAIGVAAAGPRPGRGLESAVIVPLLQADRLLGPWRDRWQPAAPVGIPACVTLAYPFLTAGELGPVALEGLGAIFAAQPPLSVRLAGVGRWPGIVYLAPEPSEPFVELAEQVQEQFPSCRPADGGTIVPHVTALRSLDDRLLDEAASALAAELPLDCRLSEAWLVQAAGAGHAWLVSEGAGERWTLRMRFALGMKRY